MIISNESIKRYLTVILNKEVSVMTKDDLTSVKTIRMSKQNQKDQTLEEMNDLLKFSNLEKLVIFNSLITADDIILLKSIKSLKTIVFEHCAFANEKELTHLNGLQGLLMNNCMLNSYDFIAGFNTLEEFEVINPSDENIIDVARIINNKLIKRLYLENCILINLDQLSCPQLVEISFINTEIKDFLFINKCPCLKTIYVPERYFKTPEIDDIKAKISVKTSYVDNLFEEDEAINKL